MSFKGTYKFNIHQFEKFLKQNYIIAWKIERQLKGSVHKPEKVHFCDFGKFRKTSSTEYFQ